MMTSNGKVMHLFYGVIEGIDQPVPFFYYKYNVSKCASFSAELHDFIIVLPPNVICIIDNFFLSYFGEIWCITLKGWKGDIYLVRSVTLCLRQADKHKRMCLSYLSVAGSDQLRTKPCHMVLKMLHYVIVQDC